MVNLFQDRFDPAMWVCRECGQLYEELPDGLTAEERRDSR